MEGVMAKIDSLKNYQEFKRIYDMHHASSDERITMYHGNGTGRLGIVAGRKYGNSVERHKFQRRIREIYRNNQEVITAGQDIIVIAKARAKESEFSEIRESFLTLLKRNRIYQEKKN